MLHAGESTGQGTRAVIAAIASLDGASPPRRCGRSSRDWASLRGSAAPARRTPRPRPRRSYHDRAIGPMTLALHRAVQDARWLTRMLLSGIRAPLS
ncbi:hypothetical protein CKO23_09365 [Thiocystis violacea]|nr:hypothetical protein [Thiocystis violacea]